tara:strand:- start:290 stop:775 length:486 start_codon:yes stop_codon:yes gene_type:complete
MAYKMKHTDGKKSSPAKFFGGAATSLVTEGMKKSLETAGKKALETIGKTGFKETLKTGVKKGLKNTLQKQILAKSKKDGISLKAAAEDIKGVKTKVKKSKVKVDKPDPKKKTFGEKLGDQALNTVGGVATHVATQALTPKEEKVVNPADSFSQMKFGNYPS